ncbi:ABC transporter substrate-binding protein [Paraburkholderia caribensis]|uniref:ABC transporter substrate-binding protein n=1 Tax=Paraburkholderia caribensis TaxID=75105 RepID=UPI0031D925D1
MTQLARVSNAAGDGRHHRSFVRFAFRGAVVLLVLLTSTVSFGRVEFGASAADADASVGCLYPLSGRSAIFGKDSIAGMRLALQDLETEIPPERLAKIRVLVDDDHSHTSIATRIAEDYIEQDKVKFLCGIVSSSLARVVSRIAEQHKIIMIGTDHASSRLTIEESHQYYFRVSNDTYASMSAGALYLKALQQRTGWKKIAFIGPDYELGHVAAQDLEDSLKQLGVQYEMVGYFWPKLYEPDYTNYISAIRESGADIVVNVLWGGDFIAFLQQAMSAGVLDKTWLANFDSGGSYDVLVSLGDRVPQHLILSARHHVNWPDTATNRKFVDDFHKLEGRYPTYVAEGAYAGIKAIGYALAKAGKHADTEQLIHALEGMHLPLPKDPPGTVSYLDPNTHQILQAEAIGEVVPNRQYPPAQVMLGNWTVYPATLLTPSPDLIRRRRLHLKTIEY